MNRSANFVQTIVRYRRMIVVMSSVLLGLTVILVALGACASIRGTDLLYPIQVATPGAGKNMSLSIGFSSDSVYTNAVPTPAAKARVTSGTLAYQIGGQSPVTVGVNGEVPIGPDVRIWNDQIVEMELDDGSAITLFPHTVIRMVKFEKIRGLPVTRIILGGGNILVASDDLWIMSSDFFFRIWVKKSMAAVSYEPLQNTIAVDCLGRKGSCVVYGLSNVNELSPGQRLEYKGSTRGKIERADFDAWQTSFREFIQTPVMTLTPTLTPTPVTKPTQTPTPTRQNRDDTDQDRGNGDEGIGNSERGGDGGKGG